MSDPVSLQDLMARELPPIKILFPGILPEDNILLLGARPQVGKTPLVQQLLLSVAAGKPWSAGEPASAQCEVLLLGLERGDRVLQRQMRAFLDGDTPPAGFYVAWSWKPMDRGGFEALDDWLGLHPKACAVAIDPWSLVKPMAGKKGGVDAYWEDYADVAKLRELVHKHHVAIVLVLHTNQSEDHKDMMAAFYGNTGQVAAVDVRALLKRKREQTDGTLEIGGTEIEERKDKVRFDYPRWSMRGSEPGEPAARSHLSPNQGLMLAALAGEPLPYGEWHARLPQLPKRTFDDNRVKLGETGWIENADGLWRLVRPAIRLKPIRVGSNLGAVGAVPL